MNVAEQLVATVPPVEAIVRLASKVPVFPCRRTAEEVTLNGRTRVLKPKSPLVSTGFKSATQDADQIRAWWRRWPDALVGVPTGTTTGLLVVDFDPLKADDAARSWISNNTELLLSTRSHGTVSGGRHYLFKLPPGQRYGCGVDVSLGGVKRCGIDIRGDGGYVVWWPMHGGTTTGDVAPLPAGLLEERRVERRDLPPLPTHSPQKWQKDRRIVSAALAWLDPADYEIWLRAGMAIHLASAGTEDGFELWHAWSAGGLTGDAPRNYSGEGDCRHHWMSFNVGRRDREDTVTLGSIFAIAGRAGWQPEPTRPETPPPGDPPPWIDSDDESVPPPPEADEAPAGKIVDKRIRWAELAPQTPPERSWAVKGWLGMGHVTLLAGPPGSGKTALCQMLASSIALGVDCIDMVPQRRRVLFWAGEDDRDELWRRQVAIANCLRVPLDRFDEQLLMLPLDQEDLTLVGSTRDGLMPTPRLAELREQIGDTKAEVVFIDSVARTFGGNENDRHDVTRFIAALQAAASPTGAAICLIGHPAKGVGSEFSGSTAWEASVRARIYFGFEMPDKKPDDEPVDPASPIRYLAKRKTNYSTRDWRQVKWTDGVMLPQTPEPGQTISRSSRSKAALAEEVVYLCRRLQTIGIAASHSPHAGNYLPKAARQAGLLTDALTDRDVKEGLAECLATGRLTVGPVGMHSNRTQKIGLVVPSEEVE